MIDLAGIRTKLADLIDLDLAGQARVHRGYIDGTAEFPLVTVGTPRWRPEVQPCIDQLTLPVALVVRQPRDDGEAVQDSLEALWSELVDALRAAIRADPTLGGLVKAAVITGAEYGVMIIQGHDYPSMNTNLDLYVRNS